VFRRRTISVSTTSSARNTFGSSDRESERTRALTAGPHAEHAPRWSRDGRWITVSDRRAEPWFGPEETALRGHHELGTRRPRATRSSSSWTHPEGRRLGRRAGLARRPDHDPLRRAAHTSSRSLAGARPLGRAAS
jgi:hypothetical protein